MAHIVMSIYDTLDNQRHACTLQSVQALLETVDLKRHRVVLVDNHSTDPNTIAFCRGMAEKYPITYVRMAENYFNHGALNYGMSLAKPSDVVITLENDVVVTSPSWADALEWMIQNGPYDILALGPSQFEKPWRRHMVGGGSMVEPGHHHGPWYVHTMKEVWNGCTAHSPRARETLGYFRPPGQYGYNDVLMSIRALEAGFELGLIIGPISYAGNNPPPDYQAWKEQQARKHALAFRDLADAYRGGYRPLYEGMFPRDMVVEEHVENQARDYWRNRGEDIIMMAYLPGGSAEGQRDVIYGAIAEQLHARNVSSILDVGGNLGLLFPFCHALDWEPRYTVVDSNPHAVQWCEEHSIEAVLGDAESLDFKKNQRSAVVLSAILNHLPDFRPALSEAFRVARDVVVVAFWKYPPSDEETIRLIHHRTGSFYENTWKRQAILDLAEECGWRLVHDELLQARETEALYVFEPN